MNSKEPSKDVALNKQAEQQFAEFVAALHHAQIGAQNEAFTRKLVLQFHDLSTRLREIEKSTMPQLHDLSKRVKELEKSTIPQLRDSAIKHDELAAKVDAMASSMNTVQKRLLDKAEQPFTRMQHDIEQLYARVNENQEGLYAHVKESNEQLYAQLQQDKEEQDRSAILQEVEQYRFALRRIVYGTLGLSCLAWAYVLFPPEQFKRSYTWFRKRLRK